MYVSAGRLVMARITGSSPSAGWVSQALFRARNTPLYIDLMSVSDLRLKALSKFSSQIPHTCELRLHHLSSSHAHVQVKGRGTNSLLLFLPFQGLRLTFGSKETKVGCGTTQTHRQTATNSAGPHTAHMRLLIFLSRS